MTLTKSVDMSPSVRVSRGVDILEKVVDRSEPVPGGFSCWQAWDSPA